MDDRVRKDSRGRQAGSQAGRLLYTICVLLLCALPFLLLPWHRSEEPIGNTELPEFPSVQTGDGFNIGFPGELAQWFGAVFPGRPELISAYSYILEKGFGQSSLETVLLGKDGWLYYSATLDDFQHKNGVSERALFNMARNTAMMQEFCGSRGADFLFTIAPNKNSLYPEHMPDRYRYEFSKESDAERLLPWLRREGVRYVDLFSLFREQEEELYYARDSHWNETGAAMVFAALLKAAGREPPTLFPSDREEEFRGDLDQMLYPVGGFPGKKECFQKDPVWKYEGEARDVEETLIRTYSEAGRGSLLMYRDSFGNSLLPYFAEEYRTAVFSREVPCPLEEEIETGTPGLVILEKVERHLPTLGKVPPLMESPDRREEFQGLKTTGSSAEPEGPLPEPEISENGKYLQVRGLLPESCRETDTRIFLAGRDEKGLFVREAFCVTIGNDDFGYQGMIPKNETGEWSGRVRAYAVMGETLCPVSEEVVRERGS